MSITSYLPIIGERRQHGSLSTDAICDIVRNERRRRLIRALDDPLIGNTKRDLADAITIEEHGTGHSAAERKAVLVALHQHHLPKLKARGVLNGRDSDMVICEDDLRQLVAAIDAIEGVASDE